MFRISWTFLEHIFFLRYQALKLKFLRRPFTAARVPPDQENRRALSDTRARDLWRGSIEILSHRPVTILLFDTFRLPGGCLPKTGYWCEDTHAVESTLKPVIILAER